MCSNGELRIENGEWKMNVESGIFRCVIRTAYCLTVGAASGRPCNATSYRLVGDHWSPLRVRVCNWFEKLTHCVNSPFSVTAIFEIPQKCLTAGDASIVLQNCGRILPEISGTASCAKCRHRLPFVRLCEGCFFFLCEVALKLYHFICKK